MAWFLTSAAHQPCAPPTQRWLIGIGMFLSAAMVTGVAAAQDQPLVFSIPVQLKQLDEAITKFHVICYVRQASGQIITFVTENTDIVGGEFDGVVEIGASLSEQEAKVAQKYSCMLYLMTGVGNPHTPVQSSGPAPDPQPNVIWQARPDAYFRIEVEGTLLTSVAIPAANDLQLAPGK